MTQAYHCECCSWKLSSKAIIAWDLLTLLRIKQSGKQKWCHLKLGFRLWQVAHLSTKNPINLWQLYFILYIQWKKTVKNMAIWHKTLSASVSRCCINFPHKLTCQILTNQSIKIGRRAWPTRDHGEKSQKQLSSLPVTAGWIFASEVSLKSKF